MPNILLTINIATQEGIMKPFLNGAKLRRKNHISTNAANGRHAMVLLCVRLHAGCHAQTECQRFNDMDIS